MILGRVVARVTGKEYDQPYNDTVFAPLGMESSFVNGPLEPPLLNRSVVAGPLEGSWNFPTNGYALPSGCILSTVNDLNKLGIAILNNTLLTPETTRLWMKPHSHTASLSYSIGAPWEIVRYTNPATGKVTDIYGKLGDSGAYGGALAVIPEYGAGISFLNAFYEPAGAPQTRGQLALEMINVIVETVVPALEAQAAKQATAGYVGVYAAIDPAANTTLVVAPAPVNGTSGLRIQSWISNGTDMLATFFSDVTPRLLPSIPKQTPAGTSGEVVFQASIRTEASSYAAAGSGPFSGFYSTNFDWATYDGQRYGGEGLSTFRFEISGGECAVAVTNAAARMRMLKVEKRAVSSYIRDGLA